MPNKISKLAEVIASQLSGKLYIGLAKVLGYRSPLKLQTNKKILRIEIDDIQKDYYIVL